VVFEHEKAITNVAVQAVLDSPRLTMISAGSAAGLARAVTDLASDLGGRWCIALLGRSGNAEYAALARGLMGGGIDDVICSREDAGLAALQCSLKKGEQTLALIDTIMSEGGVLGNSAATHAARKAAARRV